MKRLTFPCIFFLLLLATANPIDACLNGIDDVGRPTVGERIALENLSAEEFLVRLITHDSKEYWTDAAHKLKLAAHTRSHFNSLAVALIHAGRVDEAVKILEDLERKRPGDYYIATNLGTAYELKGENQKALRWIREGIKQNPLSHNGSEWLHVKILEAKISLEKDPTWLAGNSVLGINRQPNEVLSASPMTVDHLGQPKDAKQIEDALVYQLHERLEFIKPPEPVMANLLFDLSRLVSVGRSDFHGAAVRAFAERFGTDQMPWTSAEAVAIQVATGDLDRRNKFIFGGVSVLGVALLVWFFVSIRRRQRVF